MMPAGFPQIPYLQMIDDLIAHFKKYDSPLLAEAALDAVEFCRKTRQLDKVMKYARILGDEQLIKDLEAEIEADKQDGKTDLVAQLRWR
jgi:hypothetical protein